MKRLSELQYFSRMNTETGEFEEPADVTPGDTAYEDDSDIFGYEEPVDEPARSDDLDYFEDTYFEEPADVTPGDTGMYERRRRREQYNPDVTPGDRRRGDSYRDDEPADITSADRYDSYEDEFDEPADVTAGDYGMYESDSLGWYNLSRSAHYDREGRRDPSRPDDGLGGGFFGTLKPEDEDETSKDAPDDRNIPITEANPFKKAGRKFNKAMSFGGETLDGTPSTPDNIMRRVRDYSDEDLQMLLGGEEGGDGSARGFQMQTIRRELKRRGLTEGAKFKNLSDEDREKVKELVARISDKGSQITREDIQWLRSTIVPQVKGVDKLFIKGMLGVASKALDVQDKFTEGYKEGNVDSVDYKGYTITVHRNRGGMYTAKNDSGEPYTYVTQFETPEEAIEWDKKNIDQMEESAPRKGWRSKLSEGPMFPPPDKFKAGDTVRILKAPKGGEGEVVRTVPTKNKAGDYKSHYLVRVTSDSKEKGKERIYAPSELEAMNEGRYAEAHGKVVSSDDIADILFQDYDIFPADTDAYGEFTFDDLLTVADMGWFHPEDAVAHILKTYFDRDSSDTDVKFKVDQGWDDDVNEVVISDEPIYEKRSRRKESTVDPRELMDPESEYYLGDENDEIMPELDSLGGIQNTGNQYVDIERTSGKDMADFMRQYNNSPKQRMHKYLFDTHEWSKDDDQSDWDDKV
ncbi:MAG: hypothetical protein LC687_06485, partial [Actinobacteria bacterium]|nr:hypothetical protein [Actinomycetota bacterium]